MPRDRFVIDTCALISYFSEIFDNQQPSISEDSLSIMDRGFNLKDCILIFPVTVFIEIFKKWFVNDEIAEKIKVEVYQRIKDSENMEIQPFDKEILENFILITDIEKDYNFDNHDKQIFAAAMAMNCPLITSDKRIFRYNKRKGLVPRILV
jgi:predicted nucleic acid-binding protein